MVGGASSGCIFARPCVSVACSEDARLTARVLERFRDHPALQAPDGLRVQTVGGVVYLRGLVDTDLERLTAVSIARAVPDVGGVVDSISIANSR
jgi:osmotically-inducible protein OsmY